MNDFIKAQEEEFEKSIEHFKKELGNVRAGRANPAMVEDVLVDAYGVKKDEKIGLKQLIRQVGYIDVPENEKNKLPLKEKIINFCPFWICKISILFFTNVTETNFDNRSSRIIK